MRMQRKATARAKVHDARGSAAGSLRVGELFDHHDRLEALLPSTDGAACTPTPSGAARMPQLGGFLVDAQGVTLLRAWVEGLACP